LKLLTASTLVNETLSPLMMFACGISFAMISIFLFSLFIFTADFWRSYTWFAVANSLLNCHLCLTVCGLLWSCEATARDEEKIVRRLFNNMIESNDVGKRENVSVIVGSRLATQAVSRCSFAS
jgi:hypothetical protein